MGVAILGSIALSPVLSFAKENENDKGRDNENQRDKKEQSISITKNNSGKNDIKKSDDCKAFSHLFAPGWFKKNNSGASSTASGTCNTRGGVLNFFWNWNHNGDNDNDDHGNGNGGNGTTTVATTTLPTISNIVTRPRMNGADIIWTTNKATDGAVFYGTSSTVDVQSTSTAVIEKTAKSKNHSIVLKNLTASTTYFAVIRSQDAQGNKVYSNTISFTTRGITTPPVVVATSTLPTISNALAVVGTSTVATSWTTNIATNSKVFYATSSPVDLTASTTAFVVSDTLTTNHALTVSGLATSTQYFMVIKSTDASNNSVTTAQFTFTTSN